MLVSLYIEIEVFCLFILGYLFFKVSSGVDHIKNQKAFSVVIQLLFVAALLEVLQVAVDGREFYGAVIFNEVLCAGYYVSSVIMVFFMLRFICLVLKRNFDGSRKKILMFLVPLCLGVSLPILSFWTDSVFYVDDFNRFHHGELYFAYMACNFFYMMLAFVMAAHSAIQRFNYADRELYWSLCFFGVFTFVAVNLQLVVPYMPTTVPGITLALLLVYLVNQHQMVSIDPLTRLNNGNQLNHFLVSMLDRKPEFGRLYLFLMDVDCFKGINAKFGSLEGDEVLMDVARVLKEVCGPRGFFISRNAGDYFSVVAELEDDMEAMLLSAEIREKLLKISENRAYWISMSIGFASLKDGITSVPDFIEMAKRNHEVVRKSSNSEFVLKES